MRLVEVKCPGCNATMTIDRKNQRAYCEYCGTLLLIEENDPENDPQKDERYLERLRTIVTEKDYVDPKEARDLYEKGRQRAIQEAKDQAEKEEALERERQQRLKALQEAGENSSRSRRSREDEYRIPEEKTGFNYERLILGIGLIGAAILIIAIIAGQLLSFLAAWAN
ncbi:MAG: hypothetical protein J5825_06665 [Lachnospiraceae bacterium]|nr:hypothetical protein [Lachnospiraceae bacterium]